MSDNEGTGSDDWDGCMDTDGVSVNDAVGCSEDNGEGALEEVSECAGEGISEGHGEGSWEVSTDGDAVGMMVTSTGNCSNDEGGGVGDTITLLFRQACCFSCCCSPEGNDASSPECICHATEAKIIRAAAKKRNKQPTTKHWSHPGERRIHGGNKTP